MSTPESFGEAKNRREALIRSGSHRNMMQVRGRSGCIDGGGGD